MTPKDIFSNLLSIYGDEFNFKPDPECLENTPKRLEEMYNELLSGYKESPKEILKKRFLVDKNDMVIVKNIDFVSLCEHHWLPFFGEAFVGYIPKEKPTMPKPTEWLHRDPIEEQYYRQPNKITIKQYEVVGMSKIPRVVQCFAKRFQLQERMTNEIADAIYSELGCLGCIVITKAQHLCAKIRGVKNNSEMLSSAIRGVFEEANVKNEFINLLKL